MAGRKTTSLSEDAPAARALPSSATVPTAVEEVGADNPLHTTFSKR